MKIAKPFTKNSVQGAQTSIFCAVEPSLEKESGRYYRYTLEPILQSYDAKVEVQDMLSVEIT